MKSWVLAVAATIALMAPAGASASVTINTAVFNTANSKCYNAAGTAVTCTGDVNGTYGNSLTVKSNEDATLQVKISAWQAKQDTGVITSAYLGTYTGGGLGVTGLGDYNGDYNLHQIDNTVGYTDFVMLQFSRDVHLDGAGVKVYQFPTLSYTDTDMSVSLGKLSGSTGTALKLTNAATWNGSTNILSTNANAFGWTGYDRANNVTTDQSFTSKIPATTFSQIWLVAASNLTTDYNDGFKLSQILVTPRVIATPEPATWAMMIFGFGGIGASLRRCARQTVAASLAA